MDRAAIVEIIVTVVLIVISERKGDKPSLDPATTGLVTRCRALWWGVWVAFWVRESNSVRRPNPSNVVLSEPPHQGWANLSGIVRVADVGNLDPL